MATESALTLTANDISASEQAELNRWFDSMAQNAPEDREMTLTVYYVGDRVEAVENIPFAKNEDGTFVVPKGRGGEIVSLSYDGMTIGFDGMGLVITRNDWSGLIKVTDTAASEPAYNSQTGWITKTEAEARAEFEDGWNAAEAKGRADARYRHGLATSGVLRIEKGDFSEWDIISGSGDEDDDGTYTVATCYNLDDAEFFAHAHSDVAALQAENERLQAELKRVNAERDRDLAAHIDRVSALAGERDAIKAALKPFADVYTEWLKRSGNGDYKTWLHSHYLTSLSYPREWYKKAHDIISSK